MGMFPLEKSQMKLIILLRNKAQQNPNVGKEKAE